LTLIHPALIVFSGPSNNG
jgi:hypothetical protein